MKYFALWFLLCTVGALEAKAPELKARDVKHKIHEILKAHATHKKFTTELIARAIHNFIEELDPSKSYFLQSEIEPWMNPKDAFLEETLSLFNHGNYKVFEEIYALLDTAIKRRGELEAWATLELLPEGVIASEFKDLPYATTSEELSNRLLRMRALYLDMGKKLSVENPELLLQRLEKRRLNHENELWAKSPDERIKFVYSLILKASASSLDAHTNYFTPSEASQFMIQVQQRLLGIGAQLRDDLNGFTVIRILENSPASKSKLHVHDRIIAVNQEPVVGFDIHETVELIRGEAGSSVILTILRKNTENTEEKLDIELTRGEILLEETRFDTASEPFGDGVIGYLKLHSFYQDETHSSSLDLRHSLEELQKKHSLQGVLLDLRSNAGGLLPQAVSVSGLFLHKGIIASIKDCSGKIQHLRETEGRPAWEGPLVVLVNKASASAAEIVAQSLQDYGRAIIVGDLETFGKGTFQTFTLDATNNAKVNPQGEYKVTRGIYYTVSGKSPQLKGVSSDIVVPGVLSSLEFGENKTKFALPNDQIDSNFDDDLSDISPLHRLQLGSMYRYHLQKRLTTYAPFLETLRNNSTTRIASNKQYKLFLEELQKETPDSESAELLMHNDLQLTEALNILKDLVYLMRVQEKAS